MREENDAVSGPRPGERGGRETGRDFQEAKMEAESLKLTTDSQSHSQAFLIFQALANS